MIRSHYLECMHNPDRLKEMVDRMVTSIRLHPVDLLVFCGTSGQAAGWALSYALGLPVLHVRKRTATQHCAFTVEGSFPEKPANAVIVDDFVETGKTLTYIVESIETAVNNLNAGKDELWFSRAQPSVFVPDFKWFLPYKQTSLKSDLMNGGFWAIRDMEKIRGAHHRLAEIEVLGC